MSPGFLTNWTTKQGRAKQSVQSCRPFHASLDQYQHVLNQLQLTSLPTTGALLQIKNSEETFDYRTHQTSKVLITEIELSDITLHLKWSFKFSFHLQCSCYSSIPSDNDTWWKQFQIFVFIFTVVEFFLNIFGLFGIYSGGIPPKSSCLLDIYSGGIPPKSSCLLGIYSGGIPPKSSCSLGIYSGGIPPKSSCFVCVSEWRNLAHSASF